jgi:murein DD-endopeptidase MepM/ murein hydrolase activator NlpD
MGVDLAGQTGAPVLASNRGIVVIVHDFYYAGNAIHLDHGNGLTTAYMHLSESYVAVGDTVARGNIIGRVGATGRVTGPHLHWHAKYGLVTVNPLTLLDLETVNSEHAGEP